MGRSLPEVKEDSEPREEGTSPKRPLFFGGAGNPFRPTLERWNLALPCRLWQFDHEQIWKSRWIAVSEESRRWESGQLFTGRCMSLPSPQEYEIHTYYWTIVKDQSIADDLRCRRNHSNFFWPGFSGVNTVPFLPRESDKKRLLDNKESWFLNSNFECLPFRLLDALSIAAKCQDFDIMS